MKFQDLRIPLLAVLFNLFFEYSLRGINNLVTNPSLVIFLFFAYFPWFLMVEDIIRRYKPNDLKVMLLPYFGIGTIYSVFFIPIKAYFTPPFILGVNVGQFIWITLFWWTLLQTTMTMYFANRISPRVSTSPILSKKAWAVTILVWLFVGLLFRSQIQYPHIAAITYLSVVCIALIAGIIFFKSKSFEPHANPSRFMDLLTAGTIIFFIICSIIYSKSGSIDYHPINVDSLIPVVIWTTFSGVSMLMYRFISKKPFLT